MAENLVYHALDILWIFGMMNKIISTIASK